jgi:alkaline phosphatase
MKKITIAGAALLLLLILLAGGPAFSAPPKPQVKNVIIFIGDGMGVQHRRIAGIIEGKGDPNFRLNMEKMQTSGVAYNHSLDKIVTDSAASGTAIATGHKTNQKMIACSPGGAELETILEACRKLGKSTGLVTTVTITHATPACFGSHAKNRKMEEDIAIQYLNGKIEVLLGGGLDEFLPKSAEGGRPDGKTYGKRGDGRNLLEEFKSAGYTFVSDRQGLISAAPGKTKKLLGLFSRGAMAYDLDRDASREPSLGEMTQAAIGVLSKNPSGFFLMVEGGKIDWAAHGHDVAATVHDVIALDRAVKVALDFAGKNPGTLIIVVNDHETGGLTITANVKPASIMRLTATAEKMASRIKKDGSNVESVFSEMAGITDLSEKEKTVVVDEANGRYRVKDEWGYGGTVIANIISKRTGIHFATGGHSGEPVLLSVSGPGCGIFDGFYDQSEIPGKIAKLLGIKFPTGKK